METLPVSSDTITVSDNGIGLTAEEIEKYINQIALSGATDFLEKYKDSANNIIGHFGLGFYSAFMVSKKVEIVTKSYRDGAQAVKWSCDGSPEYTLEEVEKSDLIYAYGENYCYMPATWEMKKLYNTVYHQRILNLK